MKKWILVLLPALLFIATACSKDEPYIPPTVDRTVLVYMMADNSLSSYSDENIQSMMDGADGKLNGGNLIVYVDARNETPQLLQLKEGKDGRMQKFVVKDYPEQNSTSEEVIKHVFNEVKQRFPAKHYGLDLWSHGSAWLPSDYDQMMRSIGQDGSDWLEIPVLKRILAETFGSEKLDFILFDACNMASVEVAYELRNNTHAIIASQTEVMAEGFPYDAIIKDMFTAQVSCENICKSFYSFYQTFEYPYGCISYTKTADLEKLAILTKVIVQQDLDKARAISTNKLQPTDYLTSKGRLLFDMKDYLTQLATSTQSKDLYNIMSDVVPYSASTPELYFNRTGAISVDTKRLSGLSIYVMQPKYPQLNDWYKQLDWYKAIYK